MHETDGPILVRGGPAKDCPGTHGGPANNDPETHEGPATDDS